jgi:tetratricopeptide (TPR) repeat protein
MMYVDDPRIREHMATFVHMGPDIRRAKLDIAGSVDLQLDFVEFQLSMHSVNIGVVPDMDHASPEQRERFSKLIKIYARAYPMDYSIIKDADMQHMCREVQIQAIREHLDQLADHSTRFSAHCWLAMLYAEDQQYEPAEHFYRQALELRPEDIMLYSGLGLSLFYQGDYEQARSLYMQGLQRDPDNVILKRNLRQTERQLQR